MNAEKGSTKKTMKYLFFILFLLFTSSQIYAQNAKGEIYGKIVDSQSGESLIGANVFLENTSLGAASDLDGHYFIPNVPAGKHTLVVMIIGYAETRVNNIEVKQGKKTKLDLAVDPEILTTEVVVVEAKAVQNTEAALLGKRQKSVAVSDAISAEAISRSGSGDAAAAMKMVTGASVVGGKYVYVRGLGDRYSSTHLNGAELPTSDPDKKAFQMDLFPSNLLDNIVTQKTFTPDKPGNFSGGIVDIATKTFPEKFTLKVSTSSSYNTNSTLNENFLTYNGGSTDWLGYDDGKRDLPVNVDNIPDFGSALVDGSLQTAQKLDMMTDSFNNVMGPKQVSVPFNQSYSISVGNQKNIWGKEFGFLAGLTYGNNYSFYDSGQIGRYLLTGNINTIDELFQEYDFSDSEGIHEVNWGSLFNMSLKLNKHNEIHSNFLFTKSGESKTRYVSGFYKEGTLPDDAVFETRVLKYVERDILSEQLRGEHFLENLLETKIEWIASYATTTQSEPDMRFFSNHYFINGDGTKDYKIAPAVYPVPSRYYRTLDENSIVFDMKISVPFKQWQGMQSKFKFGGAYSQKQRAHREERVKYNYTTDLVDFNGDVDNFFSSERTGLQHNEDGSINMDDNGYPLFYNYITNASEDRSNYDGHKKVGAAFMMVELPLRLNLKFIGGVRMETTDMSVESFSEAYTKGEIQETDLLPSMNFIYNLSDRMNLRFGYSRTLARPTIREISQFPSEDFAAGNFVSGNPDLKRALIDNFDIRWEWFERPGEIYAVSGFYKKFYDPIERVIRNENGEIRYENVENARLFGAEFEVRKKLDQVYPALNNFSAGGNFSLVYSIVDIPESELQRIRASNPGADDTRVLQGQSPYILNLNLTYDNLNSGTAASVYYNVFGERLSEVSLGATPNIFELPRQTLNFTFKQRLYNGLGLSFSAKNILNSPVEKVYQFKRKNYIYQKYNSGANIAIGLNYAI